MWYKLTDDDRVVKLANNFDEMADNAVNIFDRKRQSRSKMNGMDFFDAEGRLVVSIDVSTVFLKLDHSPIAMNNKKEAHDPILFETMVFIGPSYPPELELFVREYESYQLRYRTLQGARKGHDKLVEHIKNKVMKIIPGTMKTRKFIVTL